MMLERKLFDDERLFGAVGLSNMLEFRELRPPPSPPDSKSASVNNNRGLFVSKSLDGEFGV